MMPDTLGAELNRLRAEYRMLEGRLGEDSSADRPDGRTRILLRAEARALLGAIVILERAGSAPASRH